jgi:eukaryotic-like serine/threonine-protein kinase
VTSFTSILAEIQDPPNEYRFFLPIVSRLYPVGMVYIPAGPVSIGCNPEHNDGFECDPLELPLHIVTLNAFFIDKYEVTNAQYADCVELGVCNTLNDVSAQTRLDYYDNPTYANYPVVRANWYQAMDYCAWAGKRLPTEEEWEKAAKGTDNRTYPWGDLSPTCDQANFNSCKGDTAEVGSYPDGASPYGVMDMAGNVMEWTYSWGSYGPNSINYPIPMSPWTFIMRGGDWSSETYFVRAAYRLPHIGEWLSGFRCAISVP